MTILFKDFISLVAFPRPGRYFGRENIYFEIRIYFNPFYFIQKVLSSHYPLKVNKISHDGELIVYFIFYNVICIK